MSPLVSIIIPNYNGSLYIEKTIESIINQSYETWEIIIVDDGSKDNSLEIIEQYAQKEQRIRFFKRLAGIKGASSCRNIGINNSTGDYLLFLDSDDLLVPFCLEKRVRFMQSNPEIDFAVFRMGYFLNNIGDTHGCLNKYAEDKTEYLKMFISYDLPWSITCPLWKREFFIRYNIRFSEHYQRLQDLELHAKILLKKNPKFQVVKNTEIDCYYRQAHLSNKTLDKTSLDKIIDSIIIFLNEIEPEIKTQFPNFLSCLDTFMVKILHTMLFYNRLNQLTPISRLYNEAKKRNKIKINKAVIILFYFFNRSRLTFKKGVGVSRLWNMISK